MAPLFALGLLLIVTVVVGCGADEESVPNPQTAANVQQAEQPQTRDSVEHGRELFANNCALCHGADLRGTSTGPSLLHEYYEPNHHSNASFVIAVLLGVRQHHWNFGNMPAVEGLAIEDVHAVICFIRETQLADGLIDEVPTSTPC